MKIKPLTHKMKNRVREHGDEWVVIKRVCGGEFEEVAISPNYAKTEPYMIWVKVGKDIEIVEESKK